MVGDYRPRVSKVIVMWWLQTQGVKSHCYVVITDPGCQKSLLCGKNLIIYHTVPSFEPFPNEKFRLFQTEKSLQTTILNLMKMAGSSPKGVENTVGKGEIARYDTIPTVPCTVDT